MTFTHRNYEKQQLWIWCILQCCEQWEVHIQNHGFFRIETDLTKTMSWRSVSQATKLMDWEGSHSIMGSQLPMNTWDLTIESADRNTWCQYPCWNLLMSSIILQLPHYCYAPWWDPTLMNQPVWLWWVPHSHLFFDGVWGKTFIY